MEARSEDYIMLRVGGVLEEEVVPGTKAGEDGEVDLNEAALVRCRQKIKSGEPEAEQRSGSGVQGQAEG